MFLSLPLVLATSVLTWEALLTCTAATLPLHFGWPTLAEPLVEDTGKAEECACSSDILQLCNCARRYNLNAPAAYLKIMLKIGQLIMTDPCDTAGRTPRIPQVAMLIR